MQHPKFFSLQVPSSFGAPISLHIDVCTRVCNVYFASITVNGGKFPLLTQNLYPTLIDWRQTANTEIRGKQWRVLSSLHVQGCGRCLFCLRILAKCECTAEAKVTILSIPWPKNTNFAAESAIYTTFTLSKLNIQYGKASRSTKSISFGFILWVVQYSMLHPKDHQLLSNEG